MKNYLNLVPISAKIHRKQSKMTRICIALAVFLVAVMFGLSDMYLQGLTNKEMQENGNWHYKISSIDTKTATFVSARPEVENSGWQKIVSVDAGCSIDGQNIAISSQDENVFEDMFLNKIVEGEYPDSENEILLSSSLKNSESISLNQTISLLSSQGNKTNYVVVGFFDDAQTSRLVTGTEQIAVLTPEAFSALKESLNNIDVVEKFVVRFSQNCNIPSTITDIKVQHNISDGQLEGNIPLLSVQGQIAGETSVNQIYQVAFMLSMVVMLTCVLMISSSLNSNIAQRTEFFGMLRCLGATRKQIMRFVRYEGLYWCKTAIPIGLVCSVVVVWILSAIMRLISPQWFSYIPFLGISWISILASSILGLITVLIAVSSPAKRASKVSPLTAVVGNTGQIVSFNRAANTRKYKIEIALGVYHAKSRKRNYILMTGAFAICIILFLSFSTLVDFMKNAFIPPVWTPDLSIASATNTWEEAKDIETLFSDDNVIFTNNLAQSQKQRNMYRAFSVLVYGFLSIIVAITIFHIMNTINMGVAAKMREYGAMRAIGMSDRQLKKMIFAEAGTYAISGVILGCVIGIPMNWVVFVSLITNIWGTAWSIPFIPIGVIITIVLFSSLLAVWGPAKRLHEMSIVENISTQ